MSHPNVRNLATLAGRTSLVLCHTTMEVQKKAILSDQQGKKSQTRKQDFQDFQDSLHTLEEGGDLFQMKRSLSPRHHRGPNVGNLLLLLLS